VRIICHARAVLELLVETCTDGEKPKSGFKRGREMIKHQYPGVVVEQDVSAVMRDGIILYSDIYRPTGRGRFPVVLMRLPYNKTRALTMTYRHPLWLARQGYVVVVQDVRGRFCSGGVFTPFLNEGKDGYDTVEWAAELPYSNGSVGMYGFSYAGATQLQAALQRPPSLKTICPAFTASQYYEGWAYRNGAFCLAFNASWASQLAMDGARKSRDSARILQFKSAYTAEEPHWESLPLTEYPPLVGEELGEFFFEWLKHPTYDDYWRQSSVEEGYRDITTPSLHIGGWYDTFVAGTVKNYIGIKGLSAKEKARATQSLLIGPWWHAPWTPIVGEADFGPEASRSVDEWQLAWLDHFLKGESADVLDAPVNVFMMGSNRWLKLTDWPPPDSRAVDYFLDSDGHAGTLGGKLREEPPQSSTPDVFIYDPVFPVPSMGGHSYGRPGRAPMGVADQRQVEALDVVLVYSSLPLERDMTVMGDVHVTLYASTTQSDTDFTAKLCDVAPDGRSYNILEGIIRARYRESLTNPVLVSPGEVYEYRLPLGPTAHTFRAGHRLRVLVTSSDFPQWDRNLNTGGQLGYEDLGQARVATQMVFHQADLPSRITLPLVEL
jgi:uncharacterized protein